MWLMKVLILAAALASCSSASVILTMDEVASQPINNLVVTKGGVTFTFTDTTGATYHSTGPGTVTYVQDPSIVGATAGEVVGVTMSQTFTVLQFGFLLNTGSSGSPIATVSLFNGASLVQSTTLNASLADPFPEALFSYGGAPVNRITITPNSATGTAFAFDNLLAGSSSVPEPSTFSMMGCGAALLAVGIYTRRKKAVRTVLS
jgi:hypothetical protein